MSSPVKSDRELVKKLGRFLRSYLRYIVWFRPQEPHKYLDTYVDTDYAACRRTMRSTNGGMILCGTHLVRSWSTTQTVVALSSGGAEYYGITNGACESISVKGIASDTGVQIKIKLHTDSSAAKGIAMRKG